MSFTGHTRSAPDETIANNGFFPDLSTKTFSDVYRLPIEYQLEMIKEKLFLALIKVNKDLEQRKIQWQQMGYSELAEVPGENYGGQTQWQRLYFLAVYAWAKADLLLSFATIAGRKEAAEDPAREGEATEQQLKATALDAIAQLIGQTTITAELL